MNRDPLARLPTGLRLWAGAGLSVLPFGQLWSYTPGFRAIGSAVYGSCDDGGYCTRDYFTPGTHLPGSTILISEAPIRLFLAGAFAALVFVAVRTRTAATRRIARAATGCLAAAAVLAAGHGSAPTLLCTLAALVLTAPPAWRAPRGPAVFGAAPLRG